MVPVFAVNWRLSWRALHCQRLYFSKKCDVIAPATRAGNALRPASRYNVLPAVHRVGKVYDGFLESIEYGFHIEILPESV